MIKETWFEFLSELIYLLWFICLTPPFLQINDIFCWEIRSPGVKGHMYIDQQQSFEYISFVGYRICYQSLLTVIILTGI